MNGMGLAGAAVFLQLHAIRMIPPIFVAAVIPVLALGAFECNTNTHGRHLQISKYL